VGNGFVHNYDIALVQPSGDNTIALNEWNHVAVAYDGTIARIYVNGDEMSSLVFSADIQTSYDYYIGYRAFDPHIPGEHWYFNGVIDEVAIYRTALSAPQIREHHENGLAETGYCHTPLVVQNILDSDDEGVRITWQSSDERSYTLYYTDALSSFTGWNPLSTFTGTGSLMEWLDDGSETGTPPTAASVLKRFYRLREEP
jgi:hypothetical protein